MHIYIYMIAYYYKDIIMKRYYFKKVIIIIIINKIIQYIKYIAKQNSNH